MANQSDARKLDPTELAYVRRSLVQAVRGGMSQTQAAGVFSVSLRAANKWVALDKVGGLRALKLKRRGRRSGEGRLNPSQANRMRQMIIDSLPDQLKLPFYLWTRAAVVNLIEQEYEIALSLTTVGRYLKSWGMSRPKPLPCMYERSKFRYAAITRQAKQEKAVICWCAETRLGAAPRRSGGNMISAITNRGHLVFMVFHGKYDGRRFVQFTQRLLRQFSGKVYLIVECHPAHRSVHAKQFVETHAQALHLIRLPSFYRERNPDEVLNQDTASKAVANSRRSESPGLMTGLNHRQVFNPMAAG